VDNFDEFQFKPITEGLGFNKKSQQMNKPNTQLTDLAGQSAPRSQSLTAPAGIYPARGPSKSPVTPKKNPGSSIQPLTQDRPTLNYQLPGVDTIESETAPSSIGHSDKIPTAIVIPAILFDAIVVIGLSSLFAFVVLLVAKVDPLNIIYMIGRDTMTLVSIGVLVFSVTQLYMIVSRSFFGSTLGEWAFDTELGSRSDQASAWYPIQVVVRTLSQVFTGFIFFPMVAALSGVDLAGKISGLRLRRG
jgi:hypothetical protein